MAKVVDLTWADLGALFLAPGTCGAGDTNAVRTGIVEGQAGNPAAGTGGRGELSSVTTGESPSRPSITNRSFGVRDSLIAPTSPTFDVWFSNDPLSVGAARTKWSVRVTADYPPSTTNNITLIQARDTAVGGRWQLDRFGAGTGFPTLYGVSGGGVSATGSPQGVIRLEIQCDVAQSPRIVFRLYQNDLTTPGYNSPITWDGFDAGSASVNHFRFGDVAGDVTTQTWRFASIEVWDTSNADGEFPLSHVQASASGFGGAPRRSYGDKVPARFSRSSDTVAATGTIGSFTNQGYGDNNRTFDLYLPDGTPPDARGFPLVLWAHPGFFVAQSKADLPTVYLAFRNRLLNAGYAVAAVGYIKSTLTDGTYQAWGTSDVPSGSNPGYGRYPSWVVDFKLCAARIAAKYAQGQSGQLLNLAGYGVDGNCIIASGSSAGGYIALAAALSRDLTNDGSSRSLTIAGNPTYAVDETSTTYTGPDPTFAGCLVFAAPTSMPALQATDWTHGFSNAVLHPPTYYSVVNTAIGYQANQGVTRTAAKAFMGLRVTDADPSGSSWTNTTIANIATQNDASRMNVPVCYVSGSSDSLVPPAQESLAITAAVSKIRSWTSIPTPAFHDANTLIAPWSDILGWLSDTERAARPRSVPVAVSG